MHVFWEKFRANFVKIPDLSVVYCSSQFIDASLVSSLVVSTSRNCDKSLIHFTDPPPPNGPLLKTMCLDNRWRNYDPFHRLDARVSCAVCSFGNDATTVR